MDFFGAITAILIVLVSVILHELAHGLVAYWLGDNTAKDSGRLTLNPLKHIDPYMSIILPFLMYILNIPVFGGAKPVPVNSRNLKGGAFGMALVAIAGPLTNFVLALLTFLIYFFTKGECFFMFDAMIINLYLMIFNLIPIPPLDGSRVLYAIAPDNVRTFLEKFEKYGVFIIYLLILVFGNFLAGFIFNIAQSVYDFFLLLVGL